MQERELTTNEKGEFIPNLAAEIGLTPILPMIAVCPVAEMPDFAKMAKLPAGTKDVPSRMPVLLLAPIIPSIVKPVLLIMVPLLLPLNMYTP